MRNTNPPNHRIDLASRRSYGCDLIRKSSSSLRLPRAVTATAKNLFLGFYREDSVVATDARTVAASCVSLASKIEARPVKAREIVGAFYRTELGRLDLYSNKFLGLVTEMNRTERRVEEDMALFDQEQDQDSDSE